MIEEYLYNDFNYRIEIDKLEKKASFDLKYPEKIKKPEFLYKYYPINWFTCDSFLNNYLFAPHPMMNNDKYDCSSELIDYSSLALESFIFRLTKETKVYSEDQVKQLYNSQDKWILERAMGDLNYMKLFMKFGIISFTENDKDILMWAYYAQNNGILLKFDVSLLPKVFYGPFPINYSEKLDKINFSKHNPAMCIHYQTNIKYSIWKNELEWRFLTYNEGGAFHPYYSKDDINSRKFYYNVNALKEIVLGYDFIDPKEMNYNENTQVYELNLNRQKNKTLKVIKKKILNHVIKLKLPCAQIIRHRYEYRFGKKELELKKISPYKLIVINGAES